MFASIIVNVPSSNVDMAFTYIVPKQYETLIKVGTRVKVPFGNSDRTIMGYVISIKNNFNQEDINLKEIVELVDLEPVISEQQLKLAMYIKDDTLCPLIRILNLMIPESLQLKPIKYFQIMDYQSIDANLATIFAGKRVIKYTKELDQYLPKIKKAIDLGHIKVTYDAVEITKEKYETKYSLNQYLYNISQKDFRPMHQEMINMLIGKEPLTKNDILDCTGMSMYLFDKLLKLNLFKETKVVVSRVKEHNIAVNNRYVKSVETYDEVVNKLEDTPKPLLWISKNVIETEGVLERLVRKNIANNDTTLILCPDIISSYKISSQIRIKTGSKVACINSNLSKQEYLDLYNEIKNDEYRVIVSTPKGAFLEYPNLKTIVMLDSENDCYYNDQSPRYDLKKVMHIASNIYNAKLCYHTYFPSLEEYVKGLKETYTLIEHQDFENDSINVQVIDLKSELLRANNSKISHKLLQKIKITKMMHKQSLLISNRKNYSNFVMCRSCGEIVKCPKCDIALQYNKKNNNLLCPACGLRFNMVKTCGNCESENFLMEGTGIEQIVENLHELLPDYKIATIVASNYDEVYQIMNKIEGEDIDIIVSTDLFSRSIMDKNIGLVAIIDLDEIIGCPSYLSNERAYSMLLHARQKIMDNQDSSMIIQTYHPDNFVVNAFICGDYKTYLKTEINNRKLQKNTPFYVINRLFVKGKYEEVFKEAWNIKKMLQELLRNKVYIIGPTYNKMHQAVQLIIKHQEKEIEEYYKKIYEFYQTSSVMIIFDKYPKYL